jgi:hypothetical protein
MGKAWCVVVVLGLVLVVHGAARGELLTVNFDPTGTPAIPQGPSSYAAAGPMQVIQVPGKLSISGGVILGFATDLNAAQSYPNVYATGDLGHTTLQNKITITLDPSFPANNISGMLANGKTTPLSYLVSAFNGTTLVNSQAFTNIAGNLTSGYVIFNVSAPAITSLTIEPTSGLPAWNFIIDNLTVNSVPEPSTVACLILGLFVFASAGTRHALRRRVPGLSLLLVNSR